MDKDTQEIFLTLVRQGIGHESKFPLKSFDWNEIKVLADEQGLSALVLSVVDKLGSSYPTLIQNMPQLLRLKWIGDVLQNYEQRYAAYEKAISSLARVYNQHGYRMMILKGYACSLEWSKQNQRPCGDIDIWQFGKWKEADTMIANEQGVKIDNSHHHHTVFDWHGFMVENHYDFINVHGIKSSKTLETIFKELGADDSHWITVNGEKVYLPSPNLHALFLINHMIAHFASVSITLRQVLDWAFFVENHTKEIDWKWLSDVMNEFHMMDFYNCINAICVGDLGFEVSLFSSVQFNPALKDRVLLDILEPQYGAEEPKNMFKRLVYKYKRWQGNAWKQELCYKDSRCSMFIDGLWAHIIKPSSL